MTTLKKYAPWLVALLVSVVSILVAMNIADRVETEGRAAYEHYADSLAAVRHSDSVSFNAAIEKIRVERDAVASERDSIERKLSTQTSTNRVVYRTVYKDSVREVMVENTKTAAVYEERISRLKDSLEQVIARKDGVHIEYVDKVVHDTVVRYVDRVDSVRVVKTVEKKRGPYGAYASARAGYGTGGLKYGADAGLKYYIAGPLYGKAGIAYDGNVSGVVGIGLDVRF